MEDLSRITVLARREIEAGVTGPLIRAFIDELGRDRALEVVRRTIDRLAEQSGRDLAEKMGGTSLLDLARGMEAWSAGGAMECHVLELTERAFDYDVTRCRYVDMYQRLGLLDLGPILSCGRDFKLLRGFNPAFRMTRTKTLMEGGDCCDFRIRLA